MLLFTASSPKFTFILFIHYSILLATRFFKLINELKSPFFVNVFCTHYETIGFTRTIEKWFCHDLHLKSGLIQTILTLVI